MAKKAAWFLETSVTIHRRIGHSRIKKNIEQRIDGRPCVTSFYVFMEYKRVLTKSLIELWGILREESSVADALHVIAQDMRPRKPKLILDVIGTMLSEGDIINDKTRALREVEMQIEASLICFENEIERFIDDTQSCPLARASIAGGYHRFLKEITCIAKCRVDRFWASHKTSLQTLIREGGTDDHLKNEGFAKIIPNIEEAHRDPTSQKTRAKCQRCGDAVIALDAPNSPTLLTFDRSFESFGRILVKPVERFDSLAAIRKSGR